MQIITIISIHTHMTHYRFTDKTNSDDVQAHLHGAPKQ